VEFILSVNYVQILKSYNNTICLWFHFDFRYWYWTIFYTLKRVGYIRMYNVNRTYNYKLKNIFYLNLTTRYYSYFIIIVTNVDWATRRKHTRQNMLSRLILHHKSVIGTWHKVLIEYHIISLYILFTRVFFLMIYNTFVTIN